MTKKILIAFGIVVVVVVLLVLSNRHLIWNDGGPVGGSGRDTPIVIAGGSIHADSDTTITRGWTAVPNDTTSYTTVLNANIKHIVVTDTADNEKNRIDLANDVADDWKIEISQVDTTPGSGNPTTPKAITIKPDLASDSSGKTLKITITNKPTKNAKWDENLPAEIRFLGNSKACLPDSIAADPLGHCDKLSTVQVTLINASQPPVTCQTSPGDGKCKIKLKIAN
jgi:hypothetical protein